MANGTEGAAEKHNELQRQIAITEAKEKALQKELDKLATVPSKTEKIAQGLENAGSKIKSVSDKVGKVGTGLSKGVTAPIAAVGAASAKAFTDVDEAMDTVVVKTGASGKALEGMAEKDDILIRPIWHMKSALYSSYSLETKPLIKMYRMNIICHHCIKLQDPESFFVCH